MTRFRRAVRLILFVFGIVAGLVGFLTAYFVRMLVRPPRQRLWANPADLGLRFHDIQFPARDGLRVSGWLVPAPAPVEQAPTLILVHGWPWNRLGTAAANLWSDLPGSEPIQLLPLVLALHRRGYQLLLFDQRNHGVSAAAGPHSFGLHEANDLLGALDYLQARKDIDMNRVGVIGFSSGANTVLFALARTDQIAAAVAVQPTSPTVFARRYARYLLGPLSRLVQPLVELGYRLFGGLRLGAVEPMFAVAGAGQTPVLYIQGEGDPWGSAANVSRMADVTSGPVQLRLVPSSDRHGGYQYAIDHPDELDAFLRQYLK
ncbi:MAG: alpha/beta fold hydrolase [Candidatus Promineifilaceae bacterium]|nr:alpha/beta fold hydrolase [Candidatus Promineifilaceae bacterium]